MSTRDDLSDMQRSFVEFYLQAGEYDEDQDEVHGHRIRATYFNATEAARRAGYADPGSQGSRLLKNVKVRALINERLKELEEQTAEVLIFLRDRATSRMGDFAEVFEEGFSVPRMLKRARALGIDHLIKEINLTDQGVRLKLYDAHQATELWGRRLKLWEDDNGKFDPTSLPPVLLNISAADPAELRRALDELRAKRGDSG